MVVVMSAGLMVEIVQGGSDRETGARDVLTERVIVAQRKVMVGQ